MVLLRNQEKYGKIVEEKERGKVKVKVVEEMYNSL